MITYKLAKELRDEGFPMNNKVDYAGGSSEKGLGSCVYCGSPTLGIFNEAVLLPTLSELIEVCGEVVLYPYQDNWYAGRPGCEGLGGRSEFYFDEYPNPIEGGKTPEIAVAKLWLKLNKPK